MALEAASCLLSVQIVSNKIESFDKHKPPVTLYNNIEKILCLEPKPDLVVWEQ